MIIHWQVGKSKFQNHMHYKVHFSELKLKRNYTYVHTLHIHINSEDFYLFFLPKSKTVVFDDAYPGFQRKYSYNI